MSLRNAGFSMRIPGEHALGRTILLYNHSYSLLLYNYSCSIPFLELGLLLQRHLLKLYIVAVTESQLNQSALNSSIPPCAISFTTLVSPKRSGRNQGWCCTSPYDLRNRAFGQWGTLPNTQCSSARSQASRTHPNSSCVSRQNSTNIRANMPSWTAPPPFFSLE